MSESLIHVNVAEEINYLAQLSGFGCAEFSHRIINSKTAFTAATAANVIDFTVPANMALIVTAIDIKTLYNTADAALPGDFRSTDDLNPYGPYVGAGAVGVVTIVVNGSPYGQAAFDIGIINAGVMFVFLADEDLQINVNPNQPVGKNLTLVTRVNAYLVRQEVATELKKNSTQIITQ